MLKTSDYFHDQINILILSDDKIYSKMLQDYIANPNTKLKLKCNVIEDINQIDEVQSKSLANLIIIDIDSKFYRNIDSLNNIMNQVDLNDIPKIVVSQSNNIEQKIHLFELGIDEFIAKPIIMPEFIAKMKNLLKKYKKFLGEKIVQVGEIKMNLINQTLEVSGTNIRLSSKEFDILRLLVENPNQIFTRKEILSSVWKGAHFINERTIDVHINRLRIALGKMTNSRSYIKTVRGAGYSLDASNATHFNNNYALDGMQNYNYDDTRSGLNSIYENSYKQNIYD